MLNEKYYYHFLNKVKLPSSLIKKCKNIKTAWENLSLENLLKLGLTEGKANPIIENKKILNEEEEINFLNKEKIEIILPENSNFPTILKEIYNSPIILYAKGDLSLLNTPSLAVVGSRKCSFYGKKAINYFIPNLVSAGLTIVSGLAYGIDSLAHEKTLQCNGKTIAVLGSSIDYIYPQNNKYLFNEIAEKGLILSEFPPTTKPEVYTFPLRNRILSGISLGTFIIEAREKSGALITGKLANEQGREVFALAGSFENECIKGNHQLIQNGEAYLIQSPKEIIEKLKSTCLGSIFLNENMNKLNSDFTETLNNKEKKVWELLEQPIHLDELKKETQFSIGELSQIISLWEIKGLIIPAGGGKIVRV